MRFPLVLTFLCLSVSAFAQNSFQLRIENLKCIEYKYERFQPLFSAGWSGRIDMNNSFPQAPVNGIATIKDDLGEFQLGFIPSKTTPIQGIPHSSFINLGAFQFGVKYNPNLYAANAKLEYTFDLTDSLTTYKVQFVISSYMNEKNRETVYLITDDTHIISPFLSETRVDQSFLFPQVNSLQKVTFNIGIFHGSWDNLPLLATVTEVPKTIRELRSLRTVTGYRGQY